MADRNDAILKLMEKPLGPEDTFQFRCKQCGSCCRDRIDILLSPFDLCRMAKELENALFTGMGGLLYLKYDIEKPLLPQVKENGVKALGIVSGIDDMMKMFGH